ncbi:hypothetical protein C486_00774 [Natrinema gari JCM 14663]|uniref:Uncharacterized protein n=2 Tax=Natrinema gari TaxID=419186 RepID=L9ZCQ0_9EURY|nr:hypothetical protein C486_00774 [Natrinema gari JCM 14663]
MRESTDAERTLPTGPLGSADIKIDVDRETYQRLHDAYLDALEVGYGEDFYTFVHNYCSTNEASVTIDGEPIDPTKTVTGSEVADR